MSGDAIRRMSSSEGRLTEDLDVLEKLGEGGFGTVFKVADKVDEAVYAVKQIRIDCKRYQLATIKREVRNLASLAHENVVRYFNSWLAPSTDQDTVSEPSSSVASGVFSPKDPQKCPANDDNHDGNADIWPVENDIDEEEFFYGPDEVFPGEDSEEYPSLEERDRFQKLESADVKQEPTVRFIDLHIKMEFCDGTLRKLIDDGLYQHEEQGWTYFRQILSGIDYIHQKGIIHRDLNPNNIFICRQTVKIGDFGLSRSSNEDPREALSIQGVSVVDVPSDLTAGVGTVLYSAPEVRHSSTYGTKADMFSIGRVFFEMNYKPMKTHMEKKDVFDGLSLNQLPLDFADDSSKSKSKIVFELVQADPGKRPSASSLLDPMKSYLPLEAAEEKRFHTTLRSVLEQPESQRFKDTVDLVFTRLQNTNAAIEQQTPSTGIAEMTNTFEEICKSHCGSKVTLPVFIPNSRYKHSQTVEVFLRSCKTGYVVAESVQAFREYLPELCNEMPTGHDRVFCITPVFTLTQSGVVKANTELSFFAVSEDTAPIVQAEMLVMLQQIIKDIPELDDCKFVLRISHDSLEQSVLKQIRVKPGQLERLIKSSGSASKLRQRFGRIVSRRYKSGAFVAALSKGGPIATYKQDVVVGSSNDMVVRSFEDISSVVSLSEKMGFNFDVEVHTILRPQQYPTCGLKFELICVTENNRVKVAAGGRFGPDDDRADTFLALTLYPSALDACRVPASEDEEAEGPVEILVACDGSTNTAESAACIVGALWEEGLKAMTTQIRLPTDIRSPVKFLVCVQQPLPLVCYMRDDQDNVQRISMKEKTVVKHIQRFNDKVIPKSLVDLINLDL